MVVARDVVIRFQQPRVVIRFWRYDAAPILSKIYKSIMTERY